MGPYYGLRLMGVAGAFTAVAEGVEGAPTNLASLANRRPDEAGLVGWQATLSSIIPGDLDVDNNGRGSPSDLSLVAVGLSLRHGRFAGGFFVDQMGVDSGITTTRTVVGGGWAAPGDAWVFGAGLHAIGYAFSRAGVPPTSASGASLAFGALYRPSGRPFRVGAALDLPASARLPVVATPPLALDRPLLPQEVVRPWKASVGVAWWLGDGELNQRMRVAAGDEPGEPVRAGLLLSADVFLVGPSGDAERPATGLEAYFADRLQLTGREATLGLRFGGETEPVRDRIRLRGGYWLEPSRYEDVLPRVHMTGGLDVYLLRLFHHRWRASFTFDVAPNYVVSSISLGLW